MLLSEWLSGMREAIEINTQQSWRVDMQAGKKLGNYLQIKKKWGFEEYLEGRYSKGAILMARFRSGSAGIGEEMARWERNVDADSDEDDSYHDISRAAICQCCVAGVVETVRHIVLVFGAYEETIHPRTDSSGAATKSCR